MLTAEAQQRIHRYAGSEGSRADELMGSAVGQIVGRMREARATRDVIYDMASEMADTLVRLREQLGDG